jgi:hypothetical protein
MPRYTEEQIKSLCAKAVATKTDREFKAAISDLRSALAEHVRLAKDSLQTRGTMLMALDAKKKIAKPEKKFWVVRLGE